MCLFLYTTKIRVYLCTYVNIIYTCVKTKARKHTCTYVCICFYAQHMHVRTYVCVYLCMNVHMLISTRACLCTLESRLACSATIMVHMKCCITGLERCVCTYLRACWFTKYGTKYKHKHMEREEREMERERERERGRDSTTYLMRKYLVNT